MKRHRSLYLLAAVALSTAALGACSKGSPTEPTPLAELEPLSAASSIAADDAAGSLTAVAEESKRRGRGRGGNGSADDNGGSGRRGRGGRGNGGGNNDDGNNGNDNGNQPGGQRPGRAGIEFEDRVAAVNGQTIRLANGTRVVVDGRTQWSSRGDLFTLAQVAGSAASGAPTRVEGRGTRQADGAILALTIKAEVDN